ncbi:MAG: Do family serine endopeptidase [Hyphomicrobiaceae bacterium]
MRLLGLTGLLLALLLGLARPASAEDVRVVPSGAGEVTLSYAPIVKRASPAVVNVYVRRRVKQLVSPFSDPILREFFGDSLGIPRERMENSLGSGVIVSADGLVVTNAHVIAGGEDAEIKVALADKREFDAKLILGDRKADLAVLRIVADGVTFPYLEFADSDVVEVGDLVLAIGNPFGVGQTVTSGIVSALARTSIGKVGSQYFIQTDAAINPGNSGGALVDMQGRLIGLNTAIVSRSGGSQGIGFAIPANLVKPFVEQAVSGRVIKRPWFGARLEPVTREMAAALGLDRVTGAFVAEVYPDGPAREAGVEEKDIVIGFADHEIEDPGALSYRLRTSEVGGTAKLAVIRDGKPVALDLPLKEAPALAAAEQRAIHGPNPFDGSRVAEVSKSLASELGSENLAGVVVVHVDTGSIAQGLGLRAGDVILRVGRSRINSIDELERVIARPQRLWRLDIRRGSQVFQLAVPG